jgi:hypothetical protein
MKKLDAKGLGMAEMCMAMVILALLAQSVVLARLVSARRTAALEDSGYASMKALQIFNELLAQANSNPWNSGGILDGYNDGLQFNLVLTIDKSVNQPGDPLSGNRQTDGHWRYLRQVQISPVSTDPQSRQVVINIWRCASDNNPMAPGILLTTIVATVVPGMTPSYSQTPPLYVIDAEHL